MSAPIVRPPKVICAGPHHRDRAEQQRAPRPKALQRFATRPHALINPVKRES